MTWKELKDKLDNLTPDQLDMDVQAWGESLPLTTASFHIASENQYFDNDWDYCCPESEIDDADFESPTLRIIAKAGEPYLWVD